MSQTWQMTPVAITPDDCIIIDAFKNPTKRSIFRIDTTNNNKL
jgi:hypothetical protein